MTPAEIRFVAQPAKSCVGCLFDSERSTVCREASAVAGQRGLPDCDAGYIYVEEETDERQIDLFAEGA